ncbi:MAG TPA: hypothetical protein VNF75_06205 [Candidatus Dormibacteraeota bacterium]|nr:hypothetical protein [Candidatus Dormibacteraeota bacterium]
MHPPRPLARQASASAAALLITLRRSGLWPPIVPSVVVVETGQVGSDASSNSLLNGCGVVTELPEPLERRQLPSGTRPGAAPRSLSSSWPLQRLEGRCALGISRISKRSLPRLAA